MNKENAEEVLRSYLRRMAQAIGEPLSPIPNSLERLSAGWVFSYQSTAYVESGNYGRFLVGHGPVVICDSGEIIEGGSLDRDPEELLSRQTRR